MRTLASALAITVLFTASAYGQPADSKTEKMFHFVHTDTPQGFQEVTNSIRAIADMQQVSLVADSKALAVRGTAGQVSMAEWLFRALDQPTGVTSTSKLEFAMPGATNDLARVFYFTNAGNPQQFQEIVNTIRSIGEVQRAFIVVQPKAVAIRGTAAQVVMAEWLMDALDKAPGGATATQSITLSTPEFRLRDGSASVAKVFYPPFLKTPQHFQESVNMIRSIAEIQRAVPYMGAGAIILRGGADQVALAEWLLNSLAKPSTAEAPPLKPPTPATPETVTRLVQLANARTPQKFQELATLVRTKANVQRVALYQAERSIILRGTAEQVAAAERLIRDADQPTQ